MIDLVLVVMVKNEENIIERCFQSAYDVGIRKMVLCPNGSTDNTVEKVENFFATRPDIRGYIKPIIWEGFGKTRTSSFNSAKEYAEYVITIDADMCLRGSIATFPETKLKGYMLTQFNSSLIYQNTRIMKSSEFWWCRGRTHEYWCCESGHNVAKIEDSILFIEDIGDGGSKSDKYERDQKLLTEDLKEMPNDARTLFYLARTYRTLGEWDKSINCFQRRIDHPNDYNEEEKWYSTYELGCVYLQKADDYKNQSDELRKLFSKQRNDVEENRYKEIIEDFEDFESAEFAFSNISVLSEGMGISTLLKAFERRPHRAESLSRLARFYREKGNTRLGYHFAKLLKETSLFPSPDQLFVDFEDHQFSADNEISITSYYLNKFEEGYDACDRIIMNNDANTSLEVLAFSNRSTYLDKMPPVEGKIVFDPAKVLPLPEGFNFSSPSIIALGDGYVFNIRLVNYKIEESTGRYIYNDKIRTENIIGVLNSKFELIRYNRLKLPDFAVGESSFTPDSSSFATRESNITGMEDIRLFWSDNDLYCSFTSLERRPTPCMCLAKINYQTLSIKKIVEITGYEDDKCQKNWMPIDDEKEIRFVYGFDPLIILTVNPDDGKVTKVEERNFNQERWRGSTQFTKTPEGMFGIIHEVLYDTPRRYYHRGVVFNNDFTKLVKSSRCFRFVKDSKIQYTCGAVVRNSEIIVGYSVFDRDSKISSIKLF